MEPLINKRFLGVKDSSECYKSLVATDWLVREAVLKSRVSQQDKIVNLLFFCCSSGGGNKEQLPMVLKIPRLTKSTLSVCERPFSLLGFGDILVPGENLYPVRGGWDGGYGGRGLSSQHCLFAKDPTPSWGLVSQVRIYTQGGEGGRGGREGRDPRSPASFSILYHTYCSWL